MQQIENLSSSASSTRIARMRARMLEAGMDAYLMRDNLDLRWITGFSGVFDEEAAHAALITRTQLFLHTDSRYADAFEDRARGGEWHIDSAPVSHAKAVVNWLRAARRDAAEHADERPLRLGIAHDTPLCEYRALVNACEEAGLAVECVEEREFVVYLRAVKDTREIAAARAAQELTDAAFAHLCGWMTVGMRERDVAFELEMFLRKSGGEALAFPSIVASGVNSACPHAMPSDKRIACGDFVTLDFGTMVDGYRSDMTRTVIMGEPNERQREVYDVVRRAHEACAARVRAGVAAKELHELAGRIIADAGYDGCFGHGLGHGVGLDIHESPTLSPRSTDILEVGNIVTIEPGIYISGEWGVRLEDFGAVTQEGFDVFTRSSHELLIL